MARPHGCHAFTICLGQRHGMISSTSIRTSSPFLANRGASKDAARATRSSRRASMARSSSACVAPRLDLDKGDHPAALCHQIDLADARFHSLCQYPPAMEPQIQPGQRFASPADALRRPCRFIPREAPARGRRASVRSSPKRLAISLAARPAGSRATASRNAASTSSASGGGASPGGRDNHHNLALGRMIGIARSKFGQRARHAFLEPLADFRAQPPPPGRPAHRPIAASVSASRGPDS